MTASYLEPQVQFEESSRIAHIKFEIRNGASEIWRASEGFAIGYQLFDTDTGTLITDGPRVTLERDLKPGESARVQMKIAFPPEDGRYHAILSPMREGVAWYYSRGWPFLALGAAVASGVARFEPVRVTTQAALHRAQMVRSLGRAVAYPLLSIWRNRGLIRVMARRDILGRYRGSFGGSFWTIINPLLLMVTYFFVFGIVLQTRFGPNQSRTGFALYFLAGELPWLAFVEAVGRAPTVLIEHRNFIKKLVFAVETLPVTLVASGLVSELFGIALFLLFLIGIRGGVPASIGWLPLLLIPQILFTAGLCWFIAALGVFVRDLGQIMGYVLTVWFFITPICYPEDSLRSAAPLFAKNPFYVLVRGYRAVFLDGRAPDFGPLWKLWLLSAAVFILGYAWFYKLRKSFPDII
jgi:lipopolysaccharide transport system permease protein